MEESAKTLFAEGCKPKCLRLVQKRGSLEACKIELEQVGLSAPTKSVVEDDLDTSHLSDARALRSNPGYLLPVDIG
jgi:hypothetical protein